jgi:hypothetical protein
MLMPQQTWRLVDTAEVLSRCTNGACSFQRPVVSHVVTLVQDSHLLNFGRIIIFETESLTPPPNCPDIMKASRRPSLTAFYNTVGIWNYVTTVAEDEVQDTASLGASGMVQDTGTMWRLVWTASVEQLRNIIPGRRRSWSRLYWEGRQIDEYELRMLKRGNSGLVSDIVWG